MDSLTADILDATVAPLLDVPLARVPPRANVVVVVEDTPGLSRQMAAICDFMGLTVAPISSAADLGMILDERRPVAVVAAFETEHQDGCHILKTVALHDRDLSVMLLTNHNASHLGATDAVEEIFQLTAVSKPIGEPNLGELVEFLARASQRGRRRRATTGGPGK